MNRPPFNSIAREQDNGASLLSGHLFFFLIGYCPEAIVVLDSAADEKGAAFIKRPAK